MSDIYGELTVQFKIRNAAGGREEDTSLGILKDARDSSWFYALSPDRVNVIGFLPWTGDLEVLEIGADLGVFAGLSGRVGRFDILDPDESHKKLILSRFPNNPNLSVIDSVSRLYDVIIISMLDRKVSAAEEVVKAAGFLKNGGKIILIADNSGALKFLAGAVKGSFRTYISDSDPEAFAQAAGLKIERVYYPLPSAAFAKSIYSDMRLPGPGDFRGISESFTDSRYVLLSEEALYGALSRAGAFTGMAPSFAVVFAKDDPSGNAQIFAAGNMPVYVKYNRMRAPKYAIGTEIFDDGGTRKVVKTALTPEASGHIESFPEKADFLGKMSARNKNAVRVIPLKGTVGESTEGLKSIEFPFIGGESLADRLSAGIIDGAVPLSEAKRYLSILLGDDDSPVYNIDALFENVLMSGDEYVLIDYEWVSGEPLERDFVRYRALKYWYEDNKDRLYAYDSFKDFLSEFGMDPLKAGDYEAIELEFQNIVRGEAKEIEEKFTLDQTYAYDIGERIGLLKDSLRRIEILESEVSRHKTALMKEREVERLSQNHIKNIEHINKINRNVIDRLNRENEYLRKHESLFSRLKRRFIARLDAYAPADSKKRVIIHYVKDTLKNPLAMMRLCLSGEGRILIKGDLDIGGEFHDGGILTVPDCESPLISIVIPVYNEVKYTYACIRSIIDNTDPAGTPYEIILADDQSSDATAEIGVYIKGLVIRRNPVNTGFLKNCNQAAAAARGKYIFFLNNDTKVHNGWLSSLHRLMESDESIGLAGSKLIYPDGRLQEAGGIIWSDGSGWNYGRFDDPDKPEYNYVKEVDYISGAAIMIRRGLWQEIGGFDEIYAPAYCEDSDLAFEVRKRGKKVVYQPASEVTHFEGISNGTDVGDDSGLKHYQLVNNGKFKEKWARELKAQEDNTGDPDPFTARDRSREKPCIAVVDHYVPTWDKDAGSLTSYQYIRMFLDHGFNVKFIGDNFLREEPYTSALGQLGVEVLYGEDYQREIYDWFRKNSPHIDFCYLQRPHIAIKYIDFLKKETGIKCIFYGHDLHFMRLMREYELTGDISKLSESEYWKSTELSVIDLADMVYYPSETEIAAIRKERPEVSAKAVSGYMWKEFKSPPSGEEIRAKKDLLFVGGFRHPPNHDAVSWFAGEVMPLVREVLPEVRFLVAGSGADEDIMRLNDPDGGVGILGFVSDERLKELYLETRLTVVPLRYGAGVKGKVVEALYNNAAIVTTAVGAEGIPDAGNVMVVADDMSDSGRETGQTGNDQARLFADAVIRTYVDEEKITELIGRAEPFMRSHYSAEAAWETVRDDFCEG